MRFRVAAKSIRLDNRGGKRMLEVVFNDSAKDAMAISHEMGENPMTKQKSPLA